MTHGSTRIQTSNCCIYCGVRSVRLTDEHVVPYSLGGQHVLERASCDVCADITKQFEQDVARGMWGDARAAYNAPTRRKKERPKDIELRDPAGLESNLIVPIHDYPAAFIFYQMPRAGILDGRDIEEDVSEKWTLIALSDDKRRDEFVSHSPGRLVVKFRHMPISFARLIAKIGYCQVLTSLQPGDFEPICLPYILGDAKNLSHIVGARSSLEQPESGIGYRISSHRFGTEDLQIIAATVRLLAESVSPTYHVIVGVVRGREHIHEVTKKLAAYTSVDIVPELFKPQKPPDDYHWLPSIWPLQV